ncbi:MAG: phosphatase PAP2 family protein [Deltaproteobacteria bacterium]|jgi:membrane-associated PAP2 superfamily phosphatase|nr:phosphatase PAP2 family protein [Deltaproteobacteria bacterium]
MTKRLLNRRKSGPLVFLLATALCVMLESVPAFDEFAQRPFFQGGSWAISGSFHARHKLMLYTGPKILIACTGFSLLVIAIWASFAGPRRKRLLPWRRPALLAAAALAIVPSAVGLGKAYSGIYGPVDLVPYGGRHEHVGLVSQLVRFGKPAGGRSFPAGHASGGFALMALSLLPASRRGKRLLFFAGMAAGWGMGTYQMARGEHFVTHTLTTMFLALAAVAILSRAFPAKNPRCGSYGRPSCPDDPLLPESERRPQDVPPGVPLRSSRT